MRLTVILADTQRTYIAIVHENEHLPYRRRSVTIELTPEQAALLTPRSTGGRDGIETREEIAGCFIENEVKP